MRTLERTILWRNLRVPGTEYCALWRTADGWHLEGTVAQVQAGQPLRVRYQLVCAPTWETQDVRIDREMGAEIQNLQLTADGQGRWWSGGIELPDLRGCRDVDLGITPSTNTLPIRRLDLPVGGSQEVVAAWVRFPDLTVEPLPQRYTRLAEDRYRYESDNGAFTADLDVDDLGLVRHYPEYWQCEATSQ